MAKQLIMRYFSPTESSNEGWEKYSLPLGNGYFGASVFGGTDFDRIQFTTNPFANKQTQGGVTNFGEAYFNFNHQKVSDYERGLDLNRGVSYSKYTVGGNSIYREAFVSYPDKVFCYKITTEMPIDFNINLLIPYLGLRPLEDGGRTGEITACKDILVMRGTLPSYELIYEARLTVKTNGIVTADGESLLLNGITTAEIFYTLDTSYKMTPEVFLDGCQKAIGDDPHDSVVLCLENAKEKGYDGLLKRHLTDYRELIGRVEFDLGGIDNGRNVEELLASNREGNFEPYLEELYYAYGRHLLVSSSRKGTTPASLQGVWTVHDKSPWTAGFWHNINVQMNYWPAFSTNLAETFEAYADYWKCYLPEAQKHATKFIKEAMPENYNAEDGECGWIIGTEACCYSITGIDITEHSGPGTGGLTSKLFWDYYDFTRDDGILKEYTYPAVHGMSKFLTKCVKNYDGRHLCKYSASPEQILAGDWVSSHKKQQYYRTVGCAFDQQFIYENAVDDIKCSVLLDACDRTTELEKQQLAAYGPVQIGYSGQIKEYDEEHFYGEFCEAHHRHLSHLMALMPGSTVTHSTPAWLDAARLTLQMRGDRSTGWALAHRLNAWARVGDGNHSYLLLQNLLKQRTHPNLWDVHPPFQIDGNFGATAGMTEMLLQSHEGYISLLPALPEVWKNVSFKGLKARGNFTVGCQYSNGKIQNCEITSNCGGKVKLRYEGFSNTAVLCGGEEINSKIDGFFVEFDTEKGKTYTLKGFKTLDKKATVTDLEAVWTKDGVRLSWEGTAKNYAVLRAEGNDSDYTVVAEIEAREFIDKAFSETAKARLTYKIVPADTAYDGATLGAVTTLHPASELEVDRYNFRFKVNNLNLK